MPEGLLVFMLKSGFEMSHVRLNLQLREISEIFVSLKY
jgi:hypothetical protein